MRILHISFSDSNGGAAIAAFRLNNLMNRYGKVESKMLVLTKGSEEHSVVSLNQLKLLFVRISNKFNNLLAAKKKCFGLFSFAYSGISIYKHKLIKNSDVIYIHWINNGMLSLTQLTKIFSLDKPTYIFCHDMWSFTGGCHQSNGCQQYKNSCNKCIFFDNKLLHILVKNRLAKKKYIFKNFNNINLIFPSKIFLNMALSSHVTHKNKIHHIPNIIDTEKFIPVQNMNEGKIRILYGAMGGKTNPYKGWNHFMYLIKKIDPIFKDKIEVFLFGYDFTEKELLEFPIKTKSYGLITDEDYMVKIYQNADIFIFPSLQESFGQTLLEAMSCGLVPLSYDVGVAPELIINELNGYIVELGNKVKLLSSFHRLLKSDNLSLMKSKSRQQVTSFFSSENIIQSHMNLIKNNLCKNG